MSTYIEHRKLNKHDTGEYHWCEIKIRGVVLLAVHEFFSMPIPTVNKGYANQEQHDMVQKTMLKAWTMLNKTGTLVLGGRRFRKVS